MLKAREAIGRFLHPVIFHVCTGSIPKLVYCYHQTNVFPKILASCFTLAIFSATAYVGFRIADEGLLWYGAQRVLAGEIPLRDFESYDPGRYYWTAATMLLLHSYGMVAANIGIAIVAAIGIWIASGLVFSGEKSAGAWRYIVVTATFIIWMYPRVKLFDIVASVILVALLAWLIQRPTLHRCFASGLGVGVIAIIGRNHGLYGATADFAALTYLVWIEKRVRFAPSILSWSAGLIIGYSPMLLATIFVPGFLPWLWASIHVYFEVGATDNSLPIPWPWLGFIPATSIIEAVRYAVIGSLMIALPVFGIVTSAYLIRRNAIHKVPINSLLLAASLLSIPYTHHVLARADIAHLAQAIFPMLIGIFAVVMNMPRRRSVILTTIICLASIFAVLPKQPLYQMWKDGNWVNTRVGPDMLFLPPETSAKVVVLTALDQKYASRGQAFLAVPYLLAAYTIANRRAPVWDPYTFFPADMVVQRAEIARIKAEQPRFVLIEEQGAFGRSSAFSYSHTNPIVYDFIRQHFVRVQDAAVPAGWGWDLYLPRVDTK